MDAAFAAQLCLRDAWPAPETHELDGWQLRAGQGGYNRANSVWPGRFTGNLSRAIDAVEAFYRGRGLTPRFQMLDIAQPAGLDAELARRGYRKDIACSDLTREAGASVMPADVTLHAEAVDDWVTLYRGGLTPERQAELPMIVAKVPPCRGFLVCRRDGAPAGVALAGRFGDDVAVDCVVTMPTFRRTGVARSLMLAAEAWATGVGGRRMLLSVVDDNEPAVALYRGLGYRRFAGYHYRSAAA